LPEGMSLTKISQKGSQITLNGIAQSNARVSGFMRSLEKSEWLVDPDLVVIQVTSADKDAQRLYNFTLSIKQVIPKASEEEDEE